MNAVNAKKIKDLKLSQPAQIVRSQSAQPSSKQQVQQKQYQQTQAPKLYNPIPAAPNTNGLQAEIAALQAAGYGHDLNFLPVEDPLRDVLNDPICDIGYDAYVGQSVSTYQQNRNRPHTQQSYQQSTTSTSSSSAYFQQYQQGQTTHVMAQHHSYSAPRSAPYGPVATLNNANSAYQAAQKWQLDAQRLKAATDGKLQNQNVKQSNSATALAVLSSTN